MGLSREFLGITNTAFSLEQGGQSYQMKWCWIEHRMWREYREWKKSWAVHPSHCNFEKKSGKPASFLGESLSSIGAAVWEGRGVKSSRWHCLEWEGRNWGHKEKGNSTYLGMWGWGFIISQRLNQKGSECSLNTGLVHVVSHIIFLFQSVSLHFFCLLHVFVWMSGNFLFIASWRKLPLLCKRCEWRKESFLLGNLKGKGYGQE